MPLRLILVLLNFVGCVTYATGQANPDSMLQLNKALTGEAKVNNLINISRQFLINNDTTGIRYAKEAIAYSKEMNFLEGKGKSYLFLALLSNLYNDNLAIDYYYQSSSILGKLGHPWTAFGYENIAKIYRDRGWYPEAMEFSLKSLAVYEKSGDTLQMVKVLSAIGFLNTQLGNNRESISRQNEALKLLNHTKNPEVKGLILGRIGIAYDEMGIYDSAHLYNDQAIALFQENKDDTYLSRWLGNKANTYIKEKKFSLAEYYLGQARRHVKTDAEVTNLLINTGKVYLETGRYRAAENVLDSAIKKTILLKQRKFWSEACYRKYELNIAQGNFAQALDYYIRFATLEDSLLDEEKAGQIAQMKIRYETGQKEKALLLEQAKNDKLDKEKALAEVAVYNRNIWMLGIAGFSIATIFFLLYLSQRNKRKAHAEKDAAIIEEREKGMKAIFEAQEEERKRIAKDLHDGLGQQLSAIKMKFQNITGKFLSDKPELKDDIGKIGKMIADAGSDVRSISHQMMPKALTELGLVEALEDMFDKSFSKSEVDCHFEHYNLTERLPQHIEIGLYRIMQELLSNIIKHSDASKVDIQLMKMQNHCILIVQDDGKGINMDGKKDGIGIMNITNRLRSLKGEMNMESASGKGTTATIRVALG